MKKFIKVFIAALYTTNSFAAIDNCFGAIKTFTKNSQMAQNGKLQELSDYKSMDLAILSDILTDNMLLADEFVQSNLISHQNIKHFVMDLNHHSPSSPDVFLVYLQNGQMARLRLHFDNQEYHGLVEEEVDVREIERSLVVQSFFSRLGVARNIIGIFSGKELSTLLGRFQMPNGYLIGVLEEETTGTVSLLDMSSRTFQSMKKLMNLKKIRQQVDIIEHFINELGLDHLRPDYVYHTPSQKVIIEDFYNVTPNFPFAGEFRDFNHRLIDNHHQFDNEEVLAFYGLKATETPQWKMTDDQLREYRYFHEPKVEESKIRPPIGSTEVIVGTALFKMRSP